MTRRAIQVLAALLIVATMASSARASEARARCVVTRINLATIHGIRTIINGWDGCTYRGRWFEVAWFVNPNGVACRRDVGAYGPSGTRNTYMAYIAYDACAVVTLGGFRAPWKPVARALATESLVSTALRITYQPG